MPGSTLHRVHAPGRKVRPRRADGHKPRLQVRARHAAATTTTTAACPAVCYAVLQALRASGGEQGHLLGLPGGHKIPPTLTSGVGAGGAGGRRRRGWLVDLWCVGMGPEQSEERNNASVL